MSKKKRFITKLLKAISKWDYNELSSLLQKPNGSDENYKCAIFVMNKQKAIEVIFNQYTGNEEQIPKIASTMKVFLLKCNNIMSKGASEWLIAFLKEIKEKSGKFSSKEFNYNDTIADILAFSFFNEIIENNNDKDLDILRQKIECNSTTWKEILFKIATFSKHYQIKFSQEHLKNKDGVVNYINHNSNTKIDNLNIYDPNIHNIILNFMINGKVPKMEPSTSVAIKQKGEKENLKKSPSNLLGDTRN